MTARMVALVRRWRVWREYSRLTGEHLDLGYRVSRHHKALYRAEAERRVP